MSQNDFRTKTYIERLKLEEKESKLIETFQNCYPDLSVSYLAKNPIRAELRFRKYATNGIAWRIFDLTDYDCVLTDDFANADDRSYNMCSDNNVRDIYIRFMGNQFSDYKNNFAVYQESKSNDLEKNM